jgi:peptide-methionine (R)-S-oxide reductase
MDNTYSEADLKNRLTPQQYSVTQEGATERPFTGELLNNKDKGVYKCVVCGEALFASDTKYDSGSGWPSFTDPMEDSAVGESTDRALGMVRTESTCANCGAHLGHVFPDGPGDSGLRYCINSASLKFEPEATS